MGTGHISNKLQRLEHVLLMRTYGMDACISAIIALMIMQP